MDKRGPSRFDTWHVDRLVDRVISAAKKAHATSSMLDLEEPQEVQRTLRSIASIGSEAYASHESDPTNVAYKKISSSGYRARLHATRSAVSALLECGPRHIIPTKEWLQAVRASGAVTDDAGLMKETAHFQHEAFESLSEFRDLLIELLDAAEGVHKPPPATHDFPLAIAISSMWGPIRLLKAELKLDNAFCLELLEAAYMDAGLPDKSNPRLGNTLRDWLRNYMKRLGI